MNKHTRQWVLAMTAVEAWALVSALAPDTGLKTLVSLVFLLYFPGKLLGRLILGNNHAWSVWADIANSVGLSLIFLMTVGLTLSLGLPPLGITQPLSAVPLTIGIASAAVILLICIIARGQLVFTSLEKPPKFTLDVGLFTLVAAAIPALAILGATSLNNGGPAIFSQLMIALACIVAVGLAWKDWASRDFTFPLGLYAISLGFLLSSSLRGWHITGHDVMQEYQVFQLTATHGVWNMAFLHDAYNACLSITVLPTIFARLTTIGDPYVYKLIFQCVFALMPVAMYSMLSRFVSKRAAFLAAIIFVAFPTFIVDMSMLGRQEIAFLMFTLAFMTAFHENMDKRPRTIATLVFLAGAVVSHYSTGYITIGVLIAAKTLESGLKIVRRLIHKPRALKPWMPISWTSVLIIATFAYLWSGPITHTSEGIARTIRGVAADIPAFVEHPFSLGRSSKSVVDGEDPKILLDHYTKTIASTGRDLPATEYYPDSLSHKYPVTVRPETYAPVTRVGKLLQSAHINLPAVYTFFRQSYANLLELLIVLSVGFFAFKRRASRMPRQYMFIAIGFLAMIVVQVILPPEAIDYGLLRLIHQSLIFIGLPIVLLAARFFNWFRISHVWHLRLIALGVIAFFLPLSGLVTSITGGYKPTLATANSGFYYDAYYTHDDELAGFTWLRKNAPYGAIANADEFTRRKMVTYVGIYPRQTMTPDTIAKDSYVFLSDSNTKTDKIPLFVGSSLIYHSVPTDFLSDNKDEVYSAGHVSIYH